MTVSPTQRTLHWYGEEAEHSCWADVLCEDTGRWGLEVQKAPTRSHRKTEQPRVCADRLALGVLAHRALKVWVSLG